MVRFERGGLAFEPGQYLRIGIAGDPEVRDYSIYSGASDDFLEVLVRRVEDGLVSRQLSELQPGERLSVEGPYGHFCLTDFSPETPLLFVASGTGISPFRSFVRSAPSLNYRLLHGIRYCEESYDAPVYGDRYWSCVSRESGGHYQGRVTEYLKAVEVDPQTEVFLCGNCDMIYDAFDLLQEKGVAASQLHTEVYF